MCNYRVHIKNKSRSYERGISPDYYDVPCGKCPDCLERNRREWFVRAFFEHKRVCDLGGCTYFILLTYDDENLPRWIDEQYNVDIPCFNPVHLRNFRANLRTRLARLLGLDKSRQIRFFFASEYGHATGRSHYHCLVFVPFHHDASIFCGTSQEKYKDGLFSKAWKHGFVGYGKNHSCVIESFAGIEYAMKYIDKDSLWIDKYDIKYIKDTYKLYDRDKYILFLRCLPKHYQSTGFGSSALPLFLSDGSVNLEMFDGIDLTKYGYIQEKFFTFPCPRYYYNKLLTKKVDDCMVLNKFGKEYKEHSFQLNLKSVKDSLISKLDVSNIKSIFSSLSSVNQKKLLYKLGVKTIDDYIEEMFLCLDIPIDYDLLSVYVFVYQYIDPEPYFKELFFMNYGKQREFLLSNALDIYMRRFDSPVFYDKKQQPSLTDESFGVHAQFSEFDCFIGYDCLYNRLMYLYRLFGELLDNKKIKDERVLDALKNIINPNLFAYV